MTDVNRVQERELIDRLNDLERVVPAYRAALEHIADHAPEVWAGVAREALYTPPNRRPYRADT
jgi:hypothetical protein